MPKIAYVPRNFTPSSFELISHARDIISDYQDQGYKLTLRQLYYQFVSRDLLPNTLRSYKRLGSIINDARLAGLIDWEAIEDRTREVVTPSHWSSPAEIVNICARTYRIDKWADQEYRPEVWIEKEALAGVVEPICRQLDISYLSCRGYTSQSEMWSSAMRLAAMTQRYNQTPIILHFGDHDPSGIDMTRDITDRLRMFTGRGGLEIRRMALNIDQVEQYNPPPNPAKTTDARFDSYMREFGHESWELDALEPRVISSLIETEVLSLRDERRWLAKVEEEEQDRATLAEVSDRWDEITGRL